MALNLASQTEAPASEAGPGGTRVVPPPPLPIEELARLFPQLEIVECLGRGGMGVVYKARQPRLDRWVALKIISPGKEKDPRFSERFAREARTLAHLSHQSIVTIYDFGEAGGLYYLLMEYVDGVSLRSLLLTRKLDPDAALKIVPAICEALQYAHQQGIVHRDIKPENILLDKAGRVKIADFGIAKILGETPTAERLTGERQVVGTPNYMAPEQVERPAAVDHRADIYSLGVVFYEMLTGELPLGKFQPPSNKVHIDVRLDEIVLHALEKEPERRYQQAVEVKTALETLGEPPTPPPITTPRPAAPDPWAQVRGPAIGLIVTAILNWVMIPLIFLGTAAFVNGMGLAKSYLILIPLSAFVSSGIILLAGLKMKGLEARALAITGSVLAMLVSPGNLVGLPVGIWALVTLFRRETRQAFAARAAGKLGPAPARPNQAYSGWGWAAAAIGSVIVLLMAIWVGAILLSITLPALHRAREVARSRALPTFVVEGVVTDAATGQPINRARVADNFYGTRPNRAPQEAWTDETGRYQLKTWNEEHTIAASAPGYETRLKTLLTAPLARATSATLDFTLKPIPESTPATTPSTGTNQPTVEPTAPQPGTGPVAPKTTGLSAWYNNRDLIRNNTFAANRREGLAVLGASEPDIHHNVFCSNPTALFIGDVNDKASSAKASGRLNLRDSLFWTNAANLVFSGAAVLADPSITNRFVLANFAGCRERDPRFRDPSRGDFSAPKDVLEMWGAQRAPLPDSPWPPQPEEKAIIQKRDGTRS